MEIITDISADIAVSQPIACAYGYFDGIHLGHLAVLNKTAQYGLKRAVVTFVNRPMSFIENYSKPDSMMSVADKISYFESLGFDYLFIFPFDKKLMSTSKEDFIKLFMVRYNVKYAVVGFNFSFGKNKEGTVENLPSLCEPYGIVPVIMPEVNFGDVPISSTLIRKHLYSGDVSAAFEMLGRPFYLKGKVKKGKQLGGKIGFPTANISVDENILIPKWGVYATFAYIGNKRYWGVTNVGNNPTVKGGALSVETHFIDFKGLLYGEEIKVEFVFRIRGEQKFKSVDALIEQISRDVDLVKSL